MPTAATPTNDENKNTIGSIFQFIHQFYDIITPVFFDLVRISSSRLVKWVDLTISGNNLFVLYEIAKLERKVIHICAPKYK